MKIVENISLRPYNTFNVEAKSSKFTVIRNEKDVIEAANSGILQEEEFFLLGSGSNVLFVDDYKGLVIRSEISGMRILGSNDDTVLLEAGAGELWHDFVTICLKNKYYGLENLALIPGTVGAAPVQNIGAYGVEQKDFFHSLRGFNLQTSEFQDLNYEDCRFGYRDSIFKNEFKGEFIVTSVRYKLSKRQKTNLTYTELQKEAAKFNIVQPDAQFVYETVCRLRMSKLPDFNLAGNAGSFFKNPLINSNLYDDLKRRFPDLKAYPAGNDKVKISAAWLIEKAGWKGKRIGDAGVYDKHALVLVNYGDASGRDIYNLAMQIRDSVFNLFGVLLEPEVIIIKSNE